jgi:hypothetical protein
MGKLYIYPKAVGKQGFAKRRWQALGHAIRGIVLAGFFWLLYAMVKRLPQAVAAIKKEG